MAIVGNTARLGALYFQSLAGRALGHGRPDAVSVVLMYHRVIDSASEALLPEPGTWVDVRTFEKQIRFLKEAFCIIPLSELTARLECGEMPRERVCALTFDDGWRDNFTNALPVLMEHNVPATLFLATGCIESGKPPWPEAAWNAFLSLRDADLRRDDAPDWPPSLEGLLWRLTCCERTDRREQIAQRCMALMKTLIPSTRARVLESLLETTGAQTGGRLMLDWDDVRAMRSEGIEFGAHTRNHAMLVRIPRQEIDREVRGSKSDIESAIGERISAFAYPNGNWNDQARRSVMQAGFRHAYTTRQSYCTQDDDMYALPRIGVHEGISEGSNSFSKRAFALRLGIT